MTWNRQLGQLDNATCGKKFFSRRFQANDQPWDAMVHRCGRNVVWLVVSNMNFLFRFIYGLSSFPLTNSIIFQDGHIAPPTSCCVVLSTVVDDDGVRTPKIWLQQIVVALFLWSFSIAMQQITRGYPTLLLAISSSQIHKWKWVSWFRWLGHEIFYISRYIMSRRMFPFRYFPG